MARVKRGVTAHARHKKVIKQAKGYRGRRKNTFKVALRYFFYQNLFLSRSILKLFSKKSTQMMTDTFDKIQFDKNFVNQKLFQIYIE